MPKRSRLSTRTISYDKSVGRLARNLGKTDMDIFQTSSALALVFEKPKKVTMDDLIEKRRKLLDIKKPTKK